MARKKIDPQAHNMFCGALIGAVMGSLSCFSAPFFASPLIGAIVGTLAGYMKETEKGK